MYEQVPDGKLEPDEPLPVATCSRCSGGIWRWERGFIGDEGLICTDCLTDIFNGLDDGLRQDYMAEAMGMEVVQFN